MWTAEGATRCAEAVLRGNGGRNVLLRFPAPAGNGDDAAELGLETPSFQDAELGPCVFRKAESTNVLMVGASAVQELAGTLAMDSAEAMFRSACGVVVDGVTYAVVDITAGEVAGQAYCFAVKLRRPAF